MKASVHLLTASAVLGLALLATNVQAAVPLAGSYATAAAAAGQFGFGRSEERKEADDLLRQAKAAIKAGDYAKAEAHLARAEKLGVKYDSFADRFKDTPQKLRQELAEAKSKKTDAKKPSSFFPALMGRKEKDSSGVPASPFAGRNQEAAINQLTDDAKAKARSFAEQGRAALSRGDKTGAIAFYQKAVSQKATFGPGEYSPDQLAADLGRAGVDVTKLPAVAANGAAPFRLTPADEDLAQMERLPSLPTANPHVGAPPSPAANPSAGEVPASGELVQRLPSAPVNEGVVQAGGAGEADPKYPVAQSLYNPAADPSRNMPANSQGSIVARAINATTSPALRCYEEGQRALERHDNDVALAKFTEAWRLQDQLDPQMRQDVQDKLTFLRTAAAQSAPGSAPPGSQLSAVQSQQELLRQKLVREIASEQKAAEKLAQTDPRGALENLKKVRERVAGAQVEAAGKKQLLTLVDRSINELSAYIEQNKATLENREHNDAVKAEVARSRELTIETQNKLAQLVEDFNKLMDEQRYAEAEVIAKQALEIDPENPVTVNMVEKSAFAKQIMFNESIKREKEAGWLGAMRDVETAAVPFPDSEPWKIGDVRRWEELTKDRKKYGVEQQRLSPVEQQIQKSLSKQVEVKFEGRPLSEVIDVLSKMSGVNIHLSDASLHSEGITSDTPVTLNLQQPISLKSALNLLLEPMRLSYVIRNEVLEITSEQTHDSNTFSKVYYVADLVMPIPNFVPSYNIGLPGALRESLNQIGSMGFGGGIRPVSTAPLTIAADEQKNLAPQMANPVALSSVLAQQAGVNLPTGGTRPPITGSGPGGLGGGVVADFDTLIDLITTTIEPDSWDEVGGPGAIQEFPANLSLVISQTQEVHEKIADLLEQLRRLQDLQVTIEVRFITLSDAFFERMGVDFDFNIDDNTGLNSFIDLLTNITTGTPPFGPFDDDNRSLNIGLGPTGSPTPTLDLEFRQGGSNSTRPTFGGFDAATAGQFGFAILSDIEAFFVLEAAQGDSRTNVLQAPKVTLFNGQTAFVSDTSQRPFVISVIPVVGDFAAAQQPVIVVLNEGTSLSVQAVVSPDRRFVRMTMVPFFSRIGDVDTFTFTGRTTSKSGTSTKDPTDDTKTVRDNEETVTEGTTVQLPTFAFTTVITTVSVPDGGTVLLGGIKRLREGRNERGIPILAKVPYVSRLFRNVGIGRDAQSLMMMVTPRIIIQEEEEEKLGINLETP